MNSKNPNLCSKSNGLPPTADRIRADERFGYVEALPFHDIEFVVDLKHQSSTLFFHVDTNP